MSHWSNALTAEYSVLSEYFYAIGEEQLPDEFPEFDKAIAAVAEVRRVLEILHTAGRVNSLRYQLEQSEIKLAELVGESQ
jgi:hypothetical protein